MLQALRNILTMRYNVIANVMGLIAKYIGIMFILPIIAALILKEPYTIVHFLTAGLVSILIGYILSANKAEQKDIDNIKKSESLAIACFAWILFALLCTIPYLFYGFSFTNALFEATSGVTTTGATVITNFSYYPKTLFFFRSLTQWFGGMGIVVLFIAVLPKMAVAGRQMFFAEAPTPTQDKATPRIRFTASWLWGIYTALTVIEMITLKILGVDWYHSLITSLSTIATGGFCALPNSIAEFNNIKIGISIIIFMFIAGMNYILIYRSLKNRTPSPIFKNEEFKAYLGIFVFLTLFLAISLVINSNYDFLKALYNSAFEIIATMTSTGFAIDNYITWDAASKVILFLAFFTGGCATSTSGGIKVVRWVFVVKYLKKELNKIVHPKGVYPLKLAGNIVDNDTSSQMITFIVFYLVLFGLGAFLILLFEKHITIALSASASAIGNIGPAFSTIGPMDNFFNLQTQSKYVLITLMLIGRLEIIPFLAILNKDLWKN